MIKVVRDFSGWEKGQRRGFAASYTFGTFSSCCDGGIEKEVHIDRMFVAVIVALQSIRRYKSADRRRYWIRT